AMRADALRKGELPHAPLDDEAHGPIRQSAPARIDEQGIGARPGPGADGQVVSERPARRLAEWYNSLFSAFTQNSNEPRLEIDLREIQPHELGTADAGGIKIGRASCRERVWKGVGEGTSKQPDQHR